MTKAINIQILSNGPRFCNNLQQAWAEVSNEFKSLRSPHLSLDKDLRFNPVVDDVHEDDIHEDN